jgi:hypothetical protein
MKKHSLIFLITFILLSVYTQKLSAEFFRGQAEDTENLNDVVQGLPYSLLIIRLVDDKGRIGDEAEPAVKKIGNGLVICAWNVEIYFHLEKYYTQLVPKLLNTLSSMDIEGKEPTTIARNTPRHKERNGKTLSAVTPFHHYPIRFGRIHEGIEIDSDSYLRVFVNIGRDKWGTNQRFKVFYLENKKYHEIFENILFPHPFKLKILLETAEQRTIREDYLDCSYSLFMANKADSDSKILINAKRKDLEYNSGSKSNSFFMIQGAVSGFQSFTISPEFNLGNYYFSLFDDTGKFKTEESDFVLTDTIMVRYETIMSEDDLKHLGSVRLSWK